ncbi:MAG: hypothetical protein R3F61_27295 [Myxococcota bacterium]
MRWLPLLALTGCMSLSRMNGAKPLEKGQIEVGLGLGARTPDDPLLFPIPVPQGPVLFRIGLGGDVDLGLRGYVLGSGFDLRYRFLQRGRWHFAVNPGVGVVVFPNLFNPAQIGTAEATMPVIAEVDASRWLSASVAAHVTYRENLSLAPDSTVARFDVYGGLGGRLEARAGLFAFGASLDGLLAPTRFTGLPGFAIGFDARLRTRSADEAEARHQKRQARSAPSDGPVRASLDNDAVLALWIAGDPKASEKRIRDALSQATRDRDTDAVLQLRTQLARARALQGDPDGADTILDGVQSRLDEASEVTRIRLGLERGRVYRARDDRAAAVTALEDAFERARAREQAYLAVDAAWTLSTVTEGEVAAEWEKRAKELAGNADDPAARSWHDMR